MLIDVDGRLVGQRGFAHAPGTQLVDVGEDLGDGGVHSHGDFPAKLPFAIQGACQWRGRDDGDAVVVGDLAEESGAAKRQQVDDASLDAGESQRLKDALEAGLTGYTYLDDTPLE